jgi:hypothetical protein
MGALLLRVLVPLVALAGLASAAAAPARAETLSDFALQLGELNQRVQLWLRLAERDPASDTVDRYVRQEADDFKKKGHIEAKDIVAIVVNPTIKDFKVRLDAANALKVAATKDLDPDVQAPKRSGANSPRGKFANDQLIRHLTDKKGDRNTRLLVHEILVAWFGNGRGKNQSAILNFKPDDEKTWSAAASAWKDIAREG